MGTGHLRENFNATFRILLTLSLAIVSIRKIKIRVYNPSLQYSNLNRAIKYQQGVPSSSCFTFKQHLEYWWFRL